MINRRFENLDLTNDQLYTMWHTLFMECYIPDEGILDLKDVTNAEVQSILKFLPQFPEINKIKTLDISHRACHTNPNCIADIIKLNIPSLTHLKLICCALYNNSIKNIANALKNNTTVMYLDISLNPFNDEGSQYIAEMLKNNSHLKHLILYQNTDVGNGWVDLADALKRNQTLEKLDLSSNYVELIPLLQALQTNVSLTHLELSGININIKYSEVQHILSLLAHNTTLLSIDLPNYLQKRVKEMFFEVHPQIAAKFLRVTGVHINITVSSLASLSLFAIKNEALHNETFRAKLNTLPKELEEKLHMENTSLQF